VYSAERFVNTRTDWSVLACSPITQANRLGALSTDDVDDDNDEYLVPSTVVRRSTKRSRRLTSPPQQSSQQHQQQTDVDRRRRTTVFRKSTTSTKLTAARTICKKAVFCIDNVSSSCSVKDLSSFVTALSIEVIWCFEASHVVVVTKPLTPTRKRLSGFRKAFCLCIKEDDRAKLLDPTVWPDSVTVSE